jgi:hypothetical protein
LSQFRGYQLAITENGMSMQIYHLKHPDYQLFQIC